MNHTERINQYIAEGRSVSGGKGDSTLSSEEKQQAGFSQQLQSAFSTQFGAQSAVLNNLTTALTPYLNGSKGFSPEQMTTLQTQNTEGAAKDFAAAQAATNNAIAARGGSQLPSGATAQLTAQNALAGAQEKAAGDQNIQLANAQQAQANQWNAVSALSGVAAQENPNQFANSEEGAANSTAGLGEAFKNSQNSQLLGALGGLAGGALSSFAAPTITKAGSTLASKI